MTTRGLAWRALGAAATLVASAAAHGQCDPIEVGPVRPDAPKRDARFGGAIAADSGVAIVGARNDPRRAIDAGAAHVYLHRGDGRWERVQTLAPDDLRAGDRFGAAVAVSGDLIAIGAPMADSRGRDAGAVYLYRREPGTDSWSLEARLLPDAVRADDRFGVSLALRGDALVIGADAHDAAAEDAGAVFVYARAGGAWAHAATLAAPDAAPGDRFGWSVATDGSTLAVGALLADRGAIDAGSVYVYRRVGAVWVPVQQLTAPVGGAGALFGHAVAVDGASLLVGVRLGSEGAERAGSAHVFARDGTTWLHAATLTADAPAAEDQFGMSVALVGDLALIGAPLASRDGARVGAAFVHRRDEGGPGAWGRLARLAPQAVRHGDLLADALALHGRLALVGAPRHDDTITDAGAAWVFEIDPDCSGCYADRDGNGRLDIRDLFCFQSRFAAGDPLADCDRNGRLDIRDFFCFQAELAAGCP